ncbi:MAG: glycosyltransferase family protein [Thermoplasmatota archaeon]
MNIIYAACSWGLGHATRSLPVIRRLIDEGNHLTIVSSGRSLDLLRKEIGDAASYADILDYPMLLSENARQFMAKTVIYWPLFLKRIESGLLQLNRILDKKRYDLIVSDGRYDMYNKKIPSFFISHQIRIMNPLRISMFETGSELFNIFFFKRFTGILVPDYKDDNLSGELSHNLKKIDENTLHYVGVLSDFRKKNLKKTVDYFFSISGPEPQRSILEQTLLSQIKNISGSIVMTLGKTETENNIKDIKDQNKDIKIYNFLSKEKREELLNKTRLVIARSGYSTIMDVGVIGTKALLIPTPGQIEQEYLGLYHNSLQTFHSVTQDAVDFKKDVVVAQKKKGITRLCDVDKTVEKIMQILYNQN